MSVIDSSLFKVDLDTYNGSLDVLLDLAKSQKVNLEDISITKLADQFHEFITNKENLNLEIASEYLLMATWLAYLKSKLLLPGTPEEEFKAQEVAERLKLQLKKLELIRLLSDQMLKRKRLGREIRTRGMKAGIKPIYNSEIKINLFLSIFQKPLEFPSLDQYMVMLIMEDIGLFSSISRCLFMRMISLVLVLLETLGIDYIQHICF